jgi:protease-4
MHNVLPTLKRILGWFWKAWRVVSMIIGSFVLAMLILIVIAVASSEGGSRFEQPSVSKKELRQGGSDVVAVVNLTGPIMEDNGDSGLIGGSSVIVSSKRMVQLLHYLKNDSSVRAVVLRINSPGGTVVASDDIYTAVRELRSVKPVVTSMADEAASGGYYIAAGSSKIVANPATITGSIGVIAQLPDISGLYSKLGIDVRTIKSGKFKDIGSPTRDMTPEELAIFNSIIDDSYQQFVQAIADGRNMSVDKVKQLADGRIYSGKQAKEAGLVDELGNMDKAIEVAEGLANVHNSQVLEYGNQSLIEQIFSSKLNLGPLKSLSNVTSPSGFKVYYLMGM